MIGDVNLSKLTRGKGEKVGANIQVVYDDKVCCVNRNYSNFSQPSSPDYLKGFD